MTKFYTIEQLRESLPSAFASSHDGNRSNRYAFLPTEQIINGMEENNWGVVKFRAPNARETLAKNFGIHELTFRSREAIALVDPRIKMMKTGENAPLFPEMRILNSHNGTCKLQVIFGLYALICSNGLTVSAAAIGEFAARHDNGFTIQDAFNLISQFIARMDKVQERIERFQTIDLEKDHMGVYAQRAAEIRWGSPFNGDSDQLLKINRVADSGNDLWSVFNRVQENMIKGGIKVGARTNRPLIQIRESNRVNEELWDLTERFAK